MKSTRKGSFSVRRSEKNPRFQRQFDKRPLSPGTSREASGVPCLNPRRGLTLLSPVCRDPEIGVSNQRYPAVPASTGDEALLQCTKPSGVPRGPSHLQFPWPLRATLRSPLRSRSEEHTSELQSPLNLVCRILLEKKKKKNNRTRKKKMKLQHNDKKEKRNKA